MRMGMGMGLGRRRRPLAGGGGNSAPVIDLNGASPGINASYIYTEGDEAAYVSPSTTVTDPDSDPLVSLTIIGTSYGQDGANEAIEFGAETFTSNADKTANVAAGDTTFQIAYTAATKRFDIAPLGGGSAPAADFQALERLFAYNNTASPPNTTTRTFTFVVNDGTDNSTAAVLTVTVEANTASLTFTTTGNWNQDDGDIYVLPDAVCTSATGAFESLEITLGGFADGDNEIVSIADRIFESATSKTTYGWVRGTLFDFAYNGTTKVLTATPTYDTFVEAAAWQDLLRTLRYWRLGAGLTVGNRTFAVSLDDGTNPALTGTFTLTEQVALTIHVVDYLGAAISGATVTLKDSLAATVDSGTSDGSGLCTFTIDENGADYTLEVTATGKQNYSTVRSISGNQHIFVMLFTNAVTIDAAWLADTGNLCNVSYTTGPYKLTAADTLYTLAANVTSDISAFSFRARCGLDIAGYDIVYDNETAVGLTNEGFETGDFTGWDTTGAPSATVEANSHTGATAPWLWGSYACKFTSISSPETIVSSAMTIPEADRPYVARVWHQGLPSNGSTVTIEVFDDVTDTSLGSQSELAGQKAPSVVFTPTTTNNIRVEVTITPVGAISCYVDDVRVRHYEVNGIYITSSPYSLEAWSEALSGAGPVGSAIYDSTGAGSISQGAGAASDASVIYAKTSSGALVIDNVTMSCDGDNSFGVTSQYKSSVFAFTSNVFTGGGKEQHILNRQSTISAVGLLNDDTGVDYYIQGNSLSALAQQGISLSHHDDAGVHLVSNNTLSTDTKVTNAYAISAATGEKVDIHYNTISTGAGGSGRGILLDAVSSVAPTDCEVAYNSVVIRERPNYEYAWNGLEATGLRLREFSSSSALNNVIAKCNRFAAYTDADHVHMSMAHRGNYTSASESTGTELRDNIFRAVAATSDTNYAAYACEIATSAGNSSDPIFYARNVYDSNVYSLALMGRDGGDVHDAEIRAPEFIETSASSRTHQTIYANGQPNTSVCDGVYIYDPVCIGGASINDVTFVGAANPKFVAIGYTAEAVVAGGAGATLTVDDDTPTEVFSGTADSSGHVSGITMLRTTYEQLTTTAATQTVTTIGDHAFTASLAGQTDGTATVTPDQPRYIPMEFDTAYGPPVLTPPSTVNATLGDTGVSATITNSGSAEEYTLLDSGTIPDDLALSGLVISGDVNAAETPGTYEPVLKAVNAYGSDTAKVTFEITSGITSPVLEGDESGTTSVQNLVVNVPAGGTDGDKLIAVVSSYPRTVATPSGWTLKGSNENPNVVGYWTYVFERTRSSEPGSYTFVQSAAGSATGWIFCFSGAGEISLEWLLENYATPLRFGGVTPASNESVVLRCGGTHNGKTVTDRTANGHTDIGMATSATATLAAMYRVEQSEASGILSFPLNSGGHRNSVCIVIPPA